VGGGGGGGGGGSVDDSSKGLVVDLVRSSMNESMPFERTIEQRQEIMFLAPK